MLTQTFASPDSQPLEEFKRHELRRRRILRDNLLEELAAGDKIFVFTSSSLLSDGDARALHKLVRRYGGRHALLCVQRTRDGRLPGDLVEMTGGLYLGFMDPSSTLDVSPRVRGLTCAERSTMHGERVRRVTCESCSRCGHNRPSDVRLRILFMR